MRILIIASLLIGLFSCKKNQNTHEVGPACGKVSCKYIYPEISNFKFKSGTYWIFIDSISLSMDTIKVVSSYGNVRPYEYCPNNLYEYYSFTVNPNGISTSSDVYSLEGNRLMINQRSEDGSVDQIYLGGAPKIDSLFVFDRYYKSVEGYLHSNGNTAYFMNTDFGFLKIETYNSSNQLVSKRLLKDKFIVR